MAKSKKSSVDRRGFLKGAAAGAAALVAKPEPAGAQQAGVQNGPNSPKSRRQWLRSSAYASGTGARNRRTAR